MNASYTVEVHRRVYDDDSGHYLTVRPSADFPETNVILISEHTEEDHWGNLRLDLPACMMRKIGEALIAASDEVEVQG